MSDEMIALVSKLTVEDWEVLHSAVWHERNNSYKEWYKEYLTETQEKVLPIIGQLRIEESIAKGKDDVV